MEIVTTTKLTEEERKKEDLKKGILVQTTQQQPQGWAGGSQEDLWGAAGWVSSCSWPVGSELPLKASAPSRWNLQWQQLCHMFYCNNTHSRYQQVVSVLLSEYNSHVPLHEGPDAPGNKAPWVSSVRWGLRASATAFSAKICPSLRPGHLRGLRSEHKCTVDNQWIKPEELKKKKKRF